SPAPHSLTVRSTRTRSCRSRSRSSERSACTPRRTPRRTDVPTVGETLTLPGGTPPENARVDVTLVGTAGVPVVGYTAGATITGTRQATVTDGAWSLDL